jgi:centromere/kinetochore protein ZW10
MDSESAAPSSIEDRLARLKNRLAKAQAEVFPPALTMSAAASLPENEDPNASFKLGLQLFGDVNHSDITARLRKLEDELDDVLALQSMGGVSSPPPVPAQDEDTLRAHISTLQRAQQMRTLLDEALTLATPSLSADDVDRVRASYTLIEAHAVWYDATERGTYSDNNKKEMWQHLHQTWRNQKAALLSWAKGVIRKRVPPPSVDEIRVQTGPDLTQAWEVLHVWHQQGDDDTLLHILRQYVQQLIQDVLEQDITQTAVFNETEERSALRLAVSTTASTSKTAWKTLTWEFPETEKSTISLLEGWKQRLGFWQRILVFVGEHVLLERPDLCTIVGQRLAETPQTLLGEVRITDDDPGRFLEFILKKLHTTCLPAPNETVNLTRRQQEMEDLVAPWEQALIDKGLWPNHHKLSTWVSSLVTHYVQHRRSLHLEKVRNLLQNSDYHNTSLVGEPYNKKDEILGVGPLIVFGLSKAAVSLVTQQVVQHVRKCLDEAVQALQEQASTEKEDAALSLLPATLYQAARESFHLLRAMIPVLHRKDIATVPRTAALWHNDCVYAAYQCQLLGLEYQSRITAAPTKDARQKVLQRCFTFVDMVPAYREIANESLQKMLDRQAQEVHSLVTSRISLLGKSLRSNEILAEWSEAESALTAAVTHLRQLSQVWKPVLSYEVFHRALCFLADVVFKILLDQLLLATDISTTACQFVNALFSRAVQDVGSLLDGDWATSQLHGRFTALSKCLDMTLHDIRVGLSQGVFSSVTGQELSQLIQATFDDSPKRRDLLQLLQQAVQQAP